MDKEVVDIKQLETYELAALQALQERVRVAQANISGMSNAIAKRYGYNPVEHEIEINLDTGKLIITKKAKEG